jgi:hypothetical protein
MRFFWCGHRWLAGLDADEPVEVVIVALVQMDFVGADSRVQNLRVTGVHTAQMFWQARACEIRPFYSGLTFD